MGDGSAKGCLRGGRLIDMNELMILGAIRKGVDALLINFKPLAGRELRAGLIFHFLGLHHGQCHNRYLLISVCADQPSRNVAATSPDSARCCLISLRPTTMRCTASGPSASLRVR